MIVCSALLISAAIDSVSSDIASIVRYLPSATCSCCAMTATAKISAIGWIAVDVLGPIGVRGALHQVERADRPPLRDERHDQRRAEARRVQDVGVEEVGRRRGDVGDDQRFARADDAAEHRLIDLEHDLGPRPGAAFLLVHARGVGLELLAVLGQQREADAIARHEPRDARGERLEGQRSRRPSAR